jgi:hypothetical protein
MSNAANVKRSGRSTQSAPVVEPISDDESDRVEAIADAVEDDDEEPSPLALEDIIDDNIDDPSEEDEDQDDDEGDGNIEEEVDEDDDADDEEEPFVSDIEHLPLYSKRETRSPAASASKAIPSFQPQREIERPSQRQTPPRRPHRVELDSRLLDVVLKERSPEFRNRVYEIVIQTGIEPDDPAFLLMLATGQIEQLLIESPKELSMMFDQWADLIHGQLDEYSKGLEKYEKAAVKAQQKAIAQSVSDLIRKTAIEKFLVSFNAVSLVVAVAASLGLIAIGGVMGIAYANYTRRTVNDLTAEQTTALQWAVSDEGRYAKDLMTWNKKLLAVSNGQRACEQDAHALNLTLMVGDRQAATGFCTLWVAPTEERQFK